MDIFSSKVNLKKYKLPGIRGYSLIELVLCIVILGVGVVSLINAFSVAVQKSVLSETITVGTNLARGLMEEIKSRRFDENYDDNPTTGGFTLPANLGPDSPESASDKSTFDDVDDFDDWTEGLVGFPGYNLSVDVFYVAEGNWDTQAGSPTNYKRIKVTVSNDSMNDIEIVSIASGW